MKKILLIAALALVPMLAMASGLSPVGTSILTEEYRCVVKEAKVIQCGNTSAECAKARQKVIVLETVDKPTAAGTSPTLVAPVSRDCAFTEFHSR